MTAMLHDLESAIRQTIPPAGDAPVVLALHGPSHAELLFTRWSGSRADWTPASQWLQREGTLARSAVVPVYADEWPGSAPRVGKAIAPESLAAMPDSGEQLRYLRWRISLLAVRPRTEESPTHLESIAPAGGAALIESEFALLPPDRRLAASGAYEVLLTTAVETPLALRETGRLRELAFRAAGEGTGRALDLDPFDDTYWHLLVWNRESREIAGGYRLRFTGNDPAELYTATLFRYGPEFLRRLGPSIELGRSFIRIEYQKSFAPLLLLWKAIGQIVARNPEYKTLFGPVSISNQYQAVSRELMIAFLEARELLADLAALVRPRNAFSRRSGVTADYCRTLDDLSGLVSDLEPGRQGVPVLLRHYLRLGGKLLGFNVDDSFAGALDGLIVVDLTRTDPRLLERYLGKAESAAVLQHHRQKGNHGHLEVNAHR